MRTLNDFCSWEFRGLFNGFVDTLRSERTAQEYISITNMITSALATDFLAIRKEDAVRYFDSLQQDVFFGRLSRQTYSTRVSCCKTVAKYIEGRLEEYQNPFYGVKRLIVDDSIKERNIPTAEEVDRIIEAAKKEPMWYLIMCLALRACLTATQLTSLRRHNILQEEDGRVLIHFPATTAASKGLWVTVPEDTKDLLLSYLEVTPGDAVGHIFFNERNNPLTIRNIDFGIRRFVKESGVKKNYSIKDLRSRGVLSLASAGVDPEVIGEYTGLSQLRVKSFVEKKHLIKGECPADSVPLQLKNFQLAEKDVS